MDEMISAISRFIVSYAFWAGPVLGLLTFGESLAVVGLFIPATTLMIAVGGLIGSGLLNLAPILVWGVAGALAGDWLSYIAGHRIGPAVWRHWPLNRHRSSVARARLFFRRFGFASVFLGRFLGPIRAIIPLVAGVMRMEMRPFQLANILSAALWVPALLAPGFLAARSLPRETVGEIHMIALAVGSIGLTLVATLAVGIVLGNDGKRRARRRRFPQ